MALSGTLDTFALPDVLRLLASTAKIGRLRITGDRGSGSVWVDGGEVVATELASASDQDLSDAEAVFGLLRFAVGSFTFESDAAEPTNVTPTALEPLLGAAENMLVEWRSIEEVISSLDVWVGLEPTLGGPDVMVDKSRWQGIAAIGSGAQVGAVAQTLEMGEIDTCRLVKELVELGLVELIEEPTGLPELSTFEPAPVEEVSSFEDGSDVSFHEVTTEPVDEFVAEPVDEEIANEVAPGWGEPEALLEELDALDDAPSFADPEVEGEGTNILSTFGTEPSLATLGSSGDVFDNDPLEQTEDIFAGGPPSAVADDELDPAEMARQLANLSPKAAKAVAAAAKATTDDEREAALAAVEAEDDTVNRGLLLKFLGSVDS